MKIHAGQKMDLTEDDGRPVAQMKEPEPKKVNPYTVENFRRILAQAAPHLIRAMDLALNSAPRPGGKELLSLQWQAFDRRQGLVFIQPGKGGGKYTADRDGH